MKRQKLKVYSDSYFLKRKAKEPHAGRVTPANTNLIFFLKITITFISSF